MAPGNYIKEVVNGEVRDPNFYFGSDFQECENVVISLIDISGSTKHLEKHCSNVQSIKGMLRSFYHDVCEEYLDRTNFQVLKFIGDAVFSIGLDGFKESQSIVKHSRNFLNRMESFMKNYGLSCTLFFCFFSKYIYSGGIPTTLYSEYNYYGPGINKVFKLSKALPRNRIYVCDHIYRNSILTAENKLKSIFHKVPQKYKICEQTMLELWSADVDKAQKKLKVKPK